MQAKAKLPSAMQAGVSDATYRALAKHPQCTRLGRECNHRDANGDLVPCEPLDENGAYRVELDHITPRVDGGTSDIDNLQWLCACENRRKYTSPDPRYSGDLYFDSPINAAKLRPHQLSLGYHLAVSEQHYRDLFVAPEKLMTRFMLLAWLVGAGKTIGMASILFGINHVRKQINGGSCRRVKRVLWLVHQRSLVRSLADELRTELTDHGIVDRAPSVVEVEHAGQWGHIADVIVACPQALWDAENRRLDDQERANILSEFDAIVVDEAHFSVARYIDLSRLAPMAFKFAVTSTPMNAEGEMFHAMDGGQYNDWFALYSAFGYQEGRRLGFYKRLEPFQSGISERLYHAENGGDAVVRQGKDTSSESNTAHENNLARDVALIKKARMIAVGQSQQSNFDHHIMVRVGSISHAKGLLSALQEDMDVCGVWSSHKGPLLGDNKHPWMLAKGNRGRIPKRGCRTVITIDIGQFGINNPYCSMIVWIEPNHSMVELVQRIGRAIRQRSEQSDSAVRLFWNGADGGMGAQVADALDYILNLDVHTDGFVSMSELSHAPSAVQLTPAERYVKPQDRVEVSSRVGGYLAHGMNEPEALASALRDIKRDKEAAGIAVTDTYMARLADYGESLQTDEGRQKALHIPHIHAPIPFVQREEPADDYGVDRLVDEVRSGVLEPALKEDSRESLISRLQEGDDLLLVMMADKMRAIDTENRKLEELTYYHPGVIAGTTKDESKYPFRTLRQQLWDYLGPASVDRKRASGKASTALNIALKQSFGFPFRKDVYQPFRTALADTLMRHAVQRTIVQRARYVALQKFPDEFPGEAKRYERELV